MGKRALSVKTSRTDMFKIDPDDIIVNHEHNGRKFSHTEDQLYRLAMTIAREGQKQPVQVRPVDVEGEEQQGVELVLGFGRHAAVQLINSGQYPELREAANLKGGEPLLILTRMASISDEQALLDNITENSNRTGTTVVDDAYNQQRLRDEHGWTNEQIAEWYGQGVAWVKRITKLLDLDEHSQRMLHLGYINVMEALELKDLTVEARQNAFEQSQKDDGKIDKKTFKSKVRGERQQKGKRSSLSMSELRKMLGNLQEHNDAVVARFAADMSRVVKGEIGEKGLRQAIERCRDQEAYMEADAEADAEDDAEPEDESEAAPEAEPEDLDEYAEEEGDE